MGKESPSVVTLTMEPAQPVRLVWKVANRAAVVAVFRGLDCVWQDADHRGRWLWIYDHEASSIGLGKRPDEIPKERHPIVLAQISFPSQGQMVMRFRAPERAIAAALFFAPRLGKNAAPDRVRILNRLVTAKEAKFGSGDLDHLLDRNVSIIDPDAHMDDLEARLDAASSQAEKRAIFERDMAERRARDVPEVEDFPLAMEEETETFTYLTTTLRLRVLRAVERWSGKPTTISSIIDRTLGVDSSSPFFPPSG